MNLNLQQFQADPTLLTQHIEWPILVLRHGPTFAFVTLCEFLALILFRYQSKALEHMRYFSNEASNIDARHIAFMSALKYLDKTKFAKLIERLDATERNFIIAKGQRTLEMANNDSEDRIFERVQRALSKEEARETKSKAKPVAKEKSK